MKCEKCQKEEILPFRCPYCGGYFCSEHRLPENHDCPKIELARAPKMETPKMIIQKQKPYEYTVSYGVLKPRWKRIRFSEKEIKHLAVAALLVIGVGFSLAQYISRDPYSLALLTLAFTMSFLLHEIAHKIAAQKKGFWAEFRLTLTGAILTLVSMLPFLPFKIISPGAVMVAGFADIKSVGKISLAGPTTNIILSTAFLATAFFVPQYFVIFMLCAFFNAWIALFNLIPFGMLDGFKVFLWNKMLWALAFVVSLILTIASSWFIF